MVAVVIAWRDRSELAESLTSICKAAGEVNGSVTIVNFGGDAHPLEKILEVKYSCPVALITSSGHKYFNKSRAANLGIAATKEEFLFFCDCDIVLPEHILDELLEAVSKSNDAFATVSSVTETKVNARSARHVSCFGYELRIRTVDGRSVRIVDNEEDAKDGSRQAPGLLCARRAHLVGIEGYNGNLHGWGWEDQDMICRLTLSAGLLRHHVGSARHISHDEESRIRHYPPVKDRWESRDRMFRQALANYDNAMFRGTLDEDRQLLQCARVHGV